MARVSELLIANPKMHSFAELEAAVIEAALSGEIHLYMDIKPEFPDTPRDWEVQLELAFYRAEAAPRE